jgi:putative ABC transport system permease protein
MQLGEAFRFSVRALSANKVRSLLTALGMVIGNASVILVVTISLTSRDYILEQIRGVGSNMVYAYYEAGGQTGADVEADFVKLADVEAVRQQLGPRIVAATGVITQYDRMIGAGSRTSIHRLRRVLSLGAQPGAAGRFMDWSDGQRRRFALLTESWQRAFMAASAPASVRC